MQRLPQFSNLIPTLWVIVWSLLGLVMYRGGHGDLVFYLNAGRTGHNFYYAYTILPLFAILAHLPYVLAAVTMHASAVAGLWILAQQFHRPFYPVLYSFPFVLVLLYSQITGLLYLGLGLAWWASRHGKWTWFGVGVWLATIKPQWGLPLILMILIDYHPSDIKGWLYLASIPTVTASVSLVLYGWWPTAIIDFVKSSPPLANQSLWLLLGPGVSVLWLFCLFGYEPLTRLKTAVGCLPIATPYMAIYDMSLAWLFLPRWASVATWVLFPLLPLMPVTLFIMSVIRMMRFTYRAKRVYEHQEVQVYAVTSTD